MLFTFPPLTRHVCPVCKEPLDEAGDEADTLRDQVFRELLTYMIGDPATIPRTLDIILISRHLERIADHAMNIAEDVIYIVRGAECANGTTRSF